MPYVSNVGWNPLVGFIFHQTPIESSNREVLMATGAPGGAAAARTGAEDGFSKSSRGTDAALLAFLVLGASLLGVSTLLISRRIRGPKPDHRNSIPPVSLEIPAHRRNTLVFPCVPEAAPDDRTLRCGPDLDAVPVFIPSGKTQRFPEEAAPEPMVGPYGTRMYTRRLPSHPVPPEVSKSEKDLPHPDWALIVALVNQRGGRTEEVCDWCRRQVRYLGRHLRSRPGREGAFWDEMRNLERRLRSADGRWPSDLEPSEASLLLAYLKLSEKIPDPFDWKAEISQMRFLASLRTMHPVQASMGVESLIRTLESDGKELEDLLKVEPLPGNRDVLKRVLRRLRENLEILREYRKPLTSPPDIEPLLDTEMRVLYLLCRKRAEQSERGFLKKYSFDIPFVFS